MALEIETLLTGTPLLSAVIIRYEKAATLGETMKRSEGRILTTHAGSLPRPDGLVQLMAAQSRGEPVDEHALTGQVDASTKDVIDKQVLAGVDIGNSGEQSRMSFSTYVTLRMSGFGGAIIGGHLESVETANPIGGVNV